jgi:anti-sigma factor RsiW
MHDQDELTRCRAEVARLQAENADLRRASESFGRLAERLNRELRAERRMKTASGGGARQATGRRGGTVSWRGVGVVG